MAHRVRWPTTLNLLHLPKTDKSADPTLLGPRRLEFWASFLLFILPSILFPSFDAFRGGVYPSPYPAKENFSKPLGLITSLGRGSPLSLVRRGDDQGGRGYGHIPLTVTATKTVYYDDIGVMQRSCTFWGALGAS